MDVKGFLAKVAFNAIGQNELAVRAAIKGFLTQYLKDYSVEDFARSVEKNLDIWDRSPRSYKMAGFKFASEHQTMYEKYKGLLTVDNVIKMLAETRPEIASYIIYDTSGRSRTWLEGQMDKIRIRIWEQNNLTDDVQLPSVEHVDGDSE